MGVGTILGADGAAATLSTLELTPADASLLREYKKFLQRMGLKEALYCAQCWNRSKEDGCEAHVTPTDIMIRCRCCMRFYKGSQF